jgi:hypothetical protein
MTPKYPKIISDSAKCLFSKAQHMFSYTSKNIRENINTGTKNLS